MCNELFSLCCNFFLLQNLQTRDRVTFSAYAYYLEYEKELELAQLPARSQNQQIAHAG